ncbi:S1 RNA-binding domain-containing protein, partial [bacterium]|nr:S1 RNA-binding domain-containing protein [bacterium]
MIENLSEKIASRLSVPVAAVERTMQLFEQGMTVPFVARYRKEVTGGMGMDQVAYIAEWVRRQVELSSRRAAILQAVEEAGAMTPELGQAIMTAPTRADLDDLYLPYRPRPAATRADKAREAGVEPLADILWKQEASDVDAETTAQPFVNAEKGVADTAGAWKMARDIVAERIAGTVVIRRELRELMNTRGTLVSRKVDDVNERDAARYREYFEFHRPVAELTPHQIITVRRGERENQLEVRIVVDREAGLAICRKHTITNVDFPLVEQIEQALEDAYDRLLLPNLEGELRVNLREHSDQQAIDQIIRQVRPLLRAAAFGPKPVLACTVDNKNHLHLAALDGAGAVSASEDFEATFADEIGLVGEIMKFVDAHGPEAVVIGKSPGGRRLEALLRSAVRDGRLAGRLIVVQSEAEAGVYATSRAAREEFPEAEPADRKVISLGRRFQEPLGELTKIDPRAIGVIPAHADVDRQALLEAMDREVSLAVNGVGVNANIAHWRHLAYVSGLNPMLAGNLVTFRDGNDDGLRTRSALHQVRKMRPEDFQQCAGFLLVHGKENPLDATFIHPERYKIVEKMAADQGIEVAELLTNPEARAKISIADYIDEEVGAPTISDILAELAEPAVDPRGEYTPPKFDESIQSIDDLQVGAKLPGVVSNITDFGAFVDVGAGQEGLVHLSQLSHRRVRSPFDEVCVGDEVEVVVTEVDKAKHRVSLSIKAAQPAPERAPRRAPRAEGQTDARPPRRPDGPERQERPRVQPKRPRLPGDPPQR